MTNVIETIETQKVEALGRLQDRVVNMGASGEVLERLKSGEGFFGLRAKVKEMGSGGGFGIMGDGGFLNRGGGGGQQPPPQNTVTTKDTTAADEPVELRMKSI